MQTTTYRLESCSVYSYRQRLYSLIFLNAVQQTVSEGNSQQDRNKMKKIVQFLQQIKTVLIFQKSITY
ncbi:MAG: hypothetical protein BWK73_53015 [Thiothrix lacustris]|uniref:Uncharacterized protein n=1 Tax=Thiothrix lacustris TaxID=525917 RepID=A0A1Y1Q7E6_9GAMM|nr:MAG: hypothetical protein BWK73_53015 [Thiothrix lacustris]